MVLGLDGLLDERDGTSGGLAFGDLDSGIDYSRGYIRALKELLKVWDCGIGHTDSLLYLLWDSKATTYQLKSMDLCP
jgi:hypothetical protein